MNMIEVKLLAVPIIFVFLRIWSELLGIITVYSDNKSCTLVTILLVLGVSVIYSLPFMSSPYKQTTFYNS